MLERVLVGSNIAYTFCALCQARLTKRLESKSAGRSPAAPEWQCLGG